MLDISVNVDVKKITYPILFDNNTCVQCGARGSLRFIDIFGRTTNQEIQPLERIQCMKCGAKYGIKWKPEGGNLIPQPTDYGADVMFTNLINHRKIKKLGNKQLQD